MNNPFFEILVIFLLLIANGLLAMSEIAIVSARKGRLQQLANEGSHQARTALELAEDPNQFLSTIQIGITLVGVLAGAFGGATIAEKIGTQLSRLPLLAPYSTAIGVGLVVVAITYFSLVIGELVPKRLGLNNAERIAAAMAPLMQRLAILASPVVWLLSVSTEAVLWLLRFTPSTEPTVTEEEVKVLIEQGTQIGIFEEAEQNMIEGVLRLDERRVNMVMTPRPQIIWFDRKASPEEIRLKIADSPHSRFPVGQDNLDNVLGIVYAKDLLIQSLAGQPPNLERVLRPALFIPESVSVLNALDIFKEKGTHIALVTDEFGGIEGLVTPDDILESIVGDIPLAEAASTEPEAKERDDGSWLLDGMLPIDRFKEIFGLAGLPDEERFLYHTVGGFVISQVGTIPQEGDSFAWDGLQFEIIDMDGRRVDKVLVVPPPAALTKN